MARADCRRQLAIRFIDVRTEVVRIGILLVEMPRMLLDVIGEVLGVESDIDVVAAGVEAHELMQRVERDHPDVVVLWADVGVPPAQCEELLRRFPWLAVLALENAGQSASVYMMQTMRFRVSEISQGDLVKAIRRAADPVPFGSRVFEADPRLTLWTHQQPS
jgi:DNA-binding NarL/FixJ family response regulator